MTRTQAIVLRISIVITCLILRSVLLVRNIIIISVLTLNLKSLSAVLFWKKATPAEEPLRKSVFNISPTVNFRYKFSKRTRLQIVYRGKSRQPNIRDLQPVTDRTNPLNIRVGNPSLKPSYTNTFTLNFNSYMPNTNGIWLLPSWRRIPLIV